MAALNTLRGSAAHTALQLLNDMGGSASDEQLRTAILSHFRSNTRFVQIIVGPLKRRGFITVDAPTIRLTSEGRAWLDSLRPTVVIAPASEMRPLKLSQKLPMREGAFDYRKYPSLAGGQRVPYQSSLPGNVDEGSNG